MAASKRALESRGLEVNAGLALTTFCLMFALLAVLDARSLWRLIGESKPDPDPSRELDLASRGERVLHCLGAALIGVLPMLGQGAWIGPQILLVLFFGENALVQIGCVSLAAGAAVLANTFIVQRWESRNGCRLLAVDRETMWTRSLGDPPANDGVHAGSRGRNRSV